ncbi:MAG: hypothetical protein ACJ72N_18345 [Labedaea sp.]
MISEPVKAQFRTWGKTLRLCLVILVVALAARIVPHEVVTAIIDAVVGG